MNEQTGISLPAPSRLLTRLLAALVLALTLLGGTPLTRAQEALEILPSTLTPTAGQPFVLTIKSNGKRANVPPDFGVEGLKVLDLRPMSSSSFSWVNGKVTQSATYSYRYILVAANPGRLVLPPFDFEVGGVTYESDAITFDVQKSATNKDQERSGKDAFIEVIPRYEKPFVGQLVPIELKVYVDSRIQITNFNQDAVRVTGEGFTYNGGSRAHESREARDGRTYKVYTFNVGITPLKVGELKTDPLDVRVRYTVPPRRRSANDPFADFPNVFNQQDGEVKAPAIELSVRPLPEEGKPASFSGAIGNFGIKVKANATKIAGSNPLVLESSITGNGNFSRVAKLSVFDAGDWKSYPEEVEFKPGDEIGFTGLKVIEHKFLPLRNTERGPGIEFSFFDPEAEEYRTIREGPFDITASGVVALPEPEEGGEVIEDGPLQDILPIDPTIPRELANRRAALWKNGVFWVGNGLAGGTFAILLVFLLLGHGEKSRLRAEKRRLQHRKSSLWGRLQNRGLGGTAFGETALKFIGTCQEIRTIEARAREAKSQPRSRRTGPGEAGVTPEEVVKSLDPARSYTHDLASLVERTHLAKYAPGHPESIEEVDRNRFLNALRKFSDDDGAASLRAVEE